MDLAFAHLLVLAWFTFIAVLKLTPILVGTEPADVWWSWQVHVRCPCKDRFIVDVNPLGTVPLFMGFGLGLTLPGRLVGEPVRSTARAGRKVFGHAWLPVGRGMKSSLLLSSILSTSIAPSTYTDGLPSALPTA